MTPRQARVVLGGFFLLAAGVTGNALLLQGAVAPAGTPKPARPVERATVPVAVPDEADPETVRAIQLELQRRGYGALVADGVVRPVVRAAIMAFEHEHRLPLTGEATQALLKRLVFGAEVGAQAPAAPEVKSPHAVAVIKEVQRLLAAGGYRAGAIDGRLSPQTIAAIKSFEAAQGLAAKGRISAEVLTRLEETEAKRHKVR